MAGFLPRILYFVSFILWNTSAVDGQLPWGPYGPEQETELADHLFVERKYDARFRSTTPTFVYVGIMPLSLNSLDIGQQVMSISASVSQIWFDWRLQWDPQKFSNITEIIVPYDAIWKPPLVVENSVDKIVFVGNDLKLPVRVAHTGLAHVSTPIALKTFCQMRILSFPFDTQRCEVHVNLWASHDGEIKFFVSEETEGWNAIYEENGEWDLMDHLQEESTPFIADGKAYTRFEISFTFRRKWVFLTLTLIVPAILNSLLMSAVFALPFECGEKVSYALTVLLTYIVLLTLVADSLPPISIEISILQIYLTGVMCTGTVATLLTCWTVTIHSRSQDIPRTRYLVAVCQTMRSVLCAFNHCPTSKNSKCPPSTSEPDKLPRSPGHSRFQGPNEVAYRRGIRADLKPHGFKANGRPFYFHESVPDYDSLSGWNGRREGMQSHHLGPNSKEEDFRRQNRSQSPQEMIPRSPAKSEVSVASSDDSDDLTWVQIAEIIDAICLRIISFVIVSGTLGVIIFFSVSY